MNLGEAFAQYRDYLEGLTPGQLPDLGNYVTKDVRFSDPFHDTVGVTEMSAIFRRLFNQVDDVVFTVLDHGTDSNSVCFFRWELTGKLGPKDWKVEGVTHLTFSSDGKVTGHREFWDAASQLYERFPVIGPLLRYCRRRIAG